jgi:hypothetical protein
VHFINRRSEKRFISKARFILKPFFRVVRTTDLAAAGETRRELLIARPDRSLRWHEQLEEVVRTRNVIVGIGLALVVAVMTGSVLLLGYVVAGASLLLVVGVLLRRAIRPKSGSSVPSSRAAWFDVNDREAA